MGEVCKEITELSFSWMNRVGESEMTEVSGVVMRAALTKTGEPRNWDHFHRGDREFGFRQAEEKA